VNVGSFDGMGDDKLLPDGVEVGAVGDDLAKPLDYLETLLGIGDGKAVSAAGSCRARGDIPELRHALRGCRQAVPS
jgi:hypothetical protein